MLSQARLSLFGPIVSELTRTVSVAPFGVTRPDNASASWRGSSCSTQFAVGSPALARKGATSTRMAPTGSRDCASAAPPRITVRSANAPHAAIAARRSHRVLDMAQSPARACWTSGRFATSRDTPEPDSRFRRDGPHEQEPPEIRAVLSPGPSADGRRSRAAVRPTSASPPNPSQHHRPGRWFGTAASRPRTARASRR